MEEHFGLLSICLLSMGIDEWTLMIADILLDHLLLLLTVVICVPIAGHHAMQRGELSIVHGGLCALLMILITVIVMSITTLVGESICPLILLEVVRRAKLLTVALVAD